MPRIFHHLRKDAREWRWLVAGWTLLLLLQAATSLTGALSGLLQVAGVLPIVTFLFPLFAIPVIVQSDAVAGSRSFWMTRPLRERELLAAKTIFIAAAFIAIPVAVDLALFLVYGLGADAFLAIPEFAIDRLWMVGAGFVAGACTATFPRACLFLASGFGIFLAAMVATESLSDYFDGSQNQHIYIPIVLSAAALIAVPLQYFLRPSRIAILFGAGSLILIPIVGELLPAFPDPAEFVQRDTSATQIGAPGLALVSEDGVLYCNYNHEPDPEYPQDGGPYVGLGAKCVVKNLPPMHSIAVIKSQLTVTFEGSGKQMTFRDSPRGLPTRRLHLGSAVGVPAAVSAAFAGENADTFPWPDADDALPTPFAFTSLHTMEQWKDRSSTVTGEATVDLFRHRVIGTVPLKPGAAWRDGETRYHLGRIGSQSVSIGRLRPNLRAFSSTRRDRGGSFAPRTLSQSALHAVVTLPATSGNSETARILSSDLMPTFATVGQGAFISANTGFYDRDETFDLTRPDEDYGLTVIRREYVGTLKIPVEIGEISASQRVDSSLAP